MKILTRFFIWLENLKSQRKFNKAQLDTLLHYKNLGYDISIITDATLSSEEMKAIMRRGYRSYNKVNE